MRSALIGNVTGPHPNQAHVSSYGSAIRYLKAVPALGGAAAKQSRRAVVAKMKALPRTTMRSDRDGCGRMAEASSRPICSR
jgi:hypothetical protein